MTPKHWTLAAILLAGTGLAGTVQAQDASPAPQEVQILSAPPSTVPAGGSEWRAFSRSTASVSLIDSGTLVTEGDEVHVKVARVPLTGAAGDYTHVVDVFGVRCDAEQTHLISSADASEDGVLTDPYDADEPWSDVRPDSFDEGVMEVGCGKARATGTAFESVKAYIDAGRP